MKIPDSIRNIPGRIGNTLPALGHGMRRGLPRVAAVALAAGAVYGLVTHPPFYTVPRGEAAVRTNMFTGHASVEREGRLLRIPGLHEVRSLPTQDRVYHATNMAHADGPGALQSLEAMKHVLPFKEQQIKQRSLEAEAANAQRIKLAEGNATARKIEAQSEADARNKLADAEVYRVAQLSKVDAERMAREGVLLTQHPLLVRKALADKLSDKVQVIIAPPSVSGGFIGSGLLGTQPVAAAAPAKIEQTQELQ